MKPKHAVWSVFLSALALVLVVAVAFAVQTTIPRTSTPATSSSAPAQGGQAYLPLVSRITRAVQVPFLGLWSGSGHNDRMAEAFRHWDEDGEIPTSCAKCHSTPGYRDFLGVDGSAAGMVDSAHPTGTTVECIACHNDVTISKTSVTFPSGITIEDLGDESRCMECHQGRASKQDVDDDVAAAAPADEDTVSEDLGFINIHYFAAAATQFGAEVEGGYQYDGMSYDHKFFHVEDYTACQDCHNQHTLDIRLEECTACHTDVESADDFVDIRMPGSLGDYDGDGDFEEGVGQEIAGLQEKLYTAIQAYGNEVSGTPIVYDAHSYPYFFVDTNGNGEVDEGEAEFGNRYNAWTARLVKAAYNFQVSQKDPGKFAHGGKYIIQLLHDSIVDVNEAISTPVDMSGAWRIDPGHFAGSEEAFRHWDDEGEVPGRCARCHSADGLPLYHKEGTNIAEDTSNGFKCTTCHASLGGDWPRLAFDDATFPSGAVVSFGEGSDPNLCLQCHQGRASGQDVIDATVGKDDDTVDPDLSFINIHYFAAGATLFGSEANGLYEYEGLEYKGRFTHVTPFDTCTECHDTHQLEVEYEECSACHPGVASPEDLVNIRGFSSTADYDGDGDTDEGIAGEIDTMADALYAAMQAYADANPDAASIVYDAHSYPYFFVDTNGNGEPDPDETNYGNRYNTWTPRLLRTAYIYQYVQKDPGGFAHNAKYIIQALYDGLADLDVDVSGMTRPSA